MYTNINSLTAKFQEFKAQVTALNPTCILITETWLSQNIPDSIIGIPGYSLIRNDRSYAKGGGVCIYIMNYICDLKVLCKTIDSFEIPGMESLWMNVLFGDIEMNLSCIYRPPSADRQNDSALLGVLENASSSLNNLLVFGDFNYPELCWGPPSPQEGNSQSAVFMNTILNSNLTQVINFPTRFRCNNNPSRLDYIFVTDTNFLSTLESFPPIGKSDHVVIIATSQLSVNTSKSSKQISRRNYKAVDYRALNEYFEDLQWPLTDINSTWDNYQTNISRGIDNYIPLSIYSSSTKPWINASIKQEINKKRKLWHKYRRTLTREDYETYRQSCNNLSNTLRTAKSRYENEIVESRSNKTFFKYVKRSLKSNIHVLALKDSNGDLITEPQAVANLFANEFSSSFAVEPLPYLPQLSENSKNNNSIDWIEFTEQKVIETLKDIKIDSSPGPDELHPILLRNCADSLAKPLSQLMRSSLEQGKLPNIWKEAIIIPIHKKGDKLDANNYRQISLTSIPCKCMEKIIAKELTEFLLANNILKNNQHGFLPGRSTVTNLLQCVDLWTKALDKNQPVDVIYLDFKKAFDLVPHQRLICKLKHYGIGGQLLKWLQDFLEGRRSCVRVSDQVSTHFPVKSGVPQGSVLGPLLFNIFIADLSMALISNASLFADDTKFFANPLVNYAQLRSDISFVQNWCSDWCLTLNENKCTVLHIGHNNPRLQYTLNNNAITPVNHQKDLGVLVSSDLKWELHIGQVIKKVNSLVYMVSITFKDITTQLLAKIYKIYIRPKLEYAVPVWSPYFAKDIHALEQTQRRITRLCPAIRNLPYEERLTVLGLTTLSCRRIRGDLIESYKILHGHYSVEVNIFVLNRDQRLRGHEFKLVREQFHKLCRQHFLANRVLPSWNSLPSRIVNAPTLNAFKNAYDNLNNL